jgi:hypothetical protein
MTFSPLIELGHIVETENQFVTVQLFPADAEESLSSPGLKGAFSWNK